MIRIISFFIVAIFVSHPAYAEQAAVTGNDHRQLIEMPAQTQQIMRAEMLDHLSVLNQIIGYMASNDLATLAEVAEKKLGKSSMGKHRGTGMGPGRFMPAEMHTIGIEMHFAASELAEAAKKTDQKGMYSALQKVTSSCVACHYSYRTR